MIREFIHKGWDSNLVNRVEQYWIAEQYLICAVLIIV